MGIRTDLVLEAVEGFGEQIPDTAQSGVKTTVKSTEGLKITTVEVLDEAAANRLGKPMGRYVTIEGLSFSGITENFEGEADAIAKELRELLPAEGPVLIAGLGNNDITPDALGPKAVNKIFATRHLSGAIIETTGLEGLRPTSAIASGVLGQTGIETAEIIGAVCERVKPAAVIVIDALASKSISRLGNTVQLSNVGISPGSGVQNARRELSQNTLGVPVVAVGVPTVVDMSTIAEGLTGRPFRDDKSDSMMVTPREIDNIVSRASKTLACAINHALQADLTLEEILALTA